MNKQINHQNKSCYISTVKAHAQLASPPPARHASPCISNTNLLFASTYTRGHTYLRTKWCFFFNKCSVKNVSVLWYRIISSVNTEMLSNDLHVYELLHYNKANTANAKHLTPLKVWRKNATLLKNAELKHKNILLLL